MLAKALGWKESGLMKNLEADAIRERAGVCRRAHQRAGKDHHQRGQREGSKYNQGDNLMPF